MNEFGVLADEPGPPSNAPRLRASLSKLTFGGNVHLGDSLVAVSGALGLHALTPTGIPQYPGLRAVELCDRNVAHCACPPTMHYRGSHDVSGTIIFRNRRVAGLVWDEKCFAGG